MTLPEIVAAIEPLLNSAAAKAVVPAIISAIFGVASALMIFWFKSKEPLHGAIAWQLVRYSSGEEHEQPFLVVQNRSSNPSYIKKARILTGNLIRREAVKYAFSYQGPFDGAFPLEIPANGVASFPLSSNTSDRLIGRARIYNKVIGYVFKRHYIFIDVTTISGRRIKVGANDTTDFQKRPQWIDRRWFPAPKPLWTFDSFLATTEKNTK